MRISVRLLVALALVAALAPALASAGEIFEVDRCAPPGEVRKPAESDEKATAECTAMIASGRYKGEALATLYAQRGDIYVQTARAKLALKDFDRALKLKPDLLAALRGRAQARSLMGDVKGAAADYARAMEIAPTDESLQHARGQLYAQAGDNDRAIADFTRAIELKPKVAQFYTERGLAFAAKGDYERARLDYIEAAKLEPANFEAVFQVCAMTLRARPAEEAVEKCSATIALRQQAPLGWHMRGLAHLKLNRVKEALADFDAALTRDGTNSGALYGRGLAKLRSGDTAGGNADIANAKARNPSVAEQAADYGIAP